MTSSISSTIAYNNFLDLFHLENSNVSVNSSLYVPVYSITNIHEDNVPLEFNIPGLPGTYLDLPESYMYLRVKVTKADGTTLPDNADVSTSNLFLHTLFEVVEIYLGGKLISSKNFYNYTAYLLAHLSFNKEYKHDLLKSALYSEESNGNQMSGNNPGYAERKKYISKSKVVELVGPLYDDIIQQKKWILTNVDLRIRLKRSANNFALLAPVNTTEYRIKFEEAVFFVKRHLVRESIVELHESNLGRQKALYPLTLNQIKTVTIPQNATNAIFENLFPSNKLPQLILIGLIDSEAFNGNYDRNPYYFQDFGLTNFNLSVDQVSLEYRNLNFSFITKTLLGFQTLVTGLNLESKGVGINRATFIDGDTLLAFQLLGYDGSNSLIAKNGSVKLELTFKNALGRQINGIVLAQSKALMTIDKYRNVEIENQGII